MAITDLERLNATAAKLRREVESHDDDGVVLVNGGDLKPEPIRWLWKDWLALGKLHILAGPPGHGKTTLALAMVATITRGGRWPDGTRCSPGNVVIWSGEDDPADTLIPRLLAMGADVSRVDFVKGTRIGGKVEPFDPARDLVNLTEAAERIGDVRLVMVDPVSSAVGGDSHKNTEVRRALQPIVDLAACMGAAAIGISHFAKGSSGRDPVDRVVGSVAFGAVARVVLVASKTTGEDGTERRVLARAKSNIGPDEGGFDYRIEQVPLDGYPEIIASRITWGSPIQGTARELLAQPDDDSDDSGDAARWLRELLSDGPMRAKDVQRHADEAGFNWRKVQRAMRKAGVTSRRLEGFPSPTEWHLVTHATVVPDKNDVVSDASVTSGMSVERGGETTSTVVPLTTLTTLATVKTGVATGGTSGIDDDEERF